VRKHVRVTLNALMRARLGGGVCFAKGIPQRGGWLFNRKNAAGFLKRAVSAYTEAGKALDNVKGSE